MYKISDTVERKFTNVFDASEWEISTDTGYESLIDVKQTVEYEVWVLLIEDGRELECADDHILFDENYTEIFVKDLKIGSMIITDTGIRKVINVYPTGIFENMYDVGVDSSDHRFYSNGFLSHNTTCASAYLLWYAMFHPDQTILVAAHKLIGAQEIMQRIRYGYELCPDHIRAGVVNYNRGSIEFENGSRIVSQTTTETTGRGMSISLLYCLDGESTVRIRDKTTLVEEDISLQDLYTRLYKSTYMFAENTNYEILTPDGWVDFRGITSTSGKITYKMTLKNGDFVSATANHYFFSNNNKIQLKDLVPGDFIDIKTGIMEIASIYEEELTTVFDIIEVNNDKHQFFVNDCFITKNCDEFAYVLPNIASEFWTSISPTLATGGKAILTSTPNSDEDEFATIWKESQDTFDEYGNEIEGGVGRNGFFGFKAEWNEHPDRDEKWMKEEMGRIGLERFNREYGLQFLVFEETLINSIRLTEIITKEPIMKMGEVRWFKKPKPGNLYMVSLDPSLGTGGDFGAIQVFELPSFEQIAEWQHNVTPIQGQVKIFREILRYIQEEIGMDHSNDIYWSTENNTVGEAALIVISDLGEETFPGLFISEPLRKGHVKKFRKGFNTTFNNKISACSRLKYLIEEDKMKINSKPLLSELKSYIASGVSFKAKPGQHDDLVAALLLVIRMSVILAEWDPKVMDILSVSGQVDDDWEPPLPLYVSTRF